MCKFNDTHSGYDLLPHSCLIHDRGTRNRCLFHFTNTNIGPKDDVADYETGRQQHPGQLLNAIGQVAPPVTALASGVGELSDLVVASHLELQNHLSFPIIILHVL
jgi:hypothetical protein